MSCNMAAIESHEQTFNAKHSAIRSLLAGLGSSDRTFTQVIENSVPASDMVLWGGYMFMSPRRCRVSNGYV